MTSPTPDPGIGARSRIAWRLLPFLFLLYIVNYIDRTNIAYAKLGMKSDWGMTDAIFGTASGIFFIGYFALQIPGALLVERWSAKRLLGLTLIAWGALTTLTALVRTPLQLYGARFLLGAAEAGFFPGVIVYLSHWFVGEDRAKAGGWFMSAIPIGFMIGSPIAGSLLGVDWLGIPGWRWLFLLEGAPAIALGVATFFYLPDQLEEADWLEPEERGWIKTRLSEERRAKAYAKEMTIWQALRHPPVLVLTAGLFFTYTGGYAFWFFFPTILERFTGWTVHKIGWVGAIPFAAALIGMLVVGWNSDRTRERRWHFVIPQLTAAVSLAAWFLVPHSTSALIAVCILVVFGTIAYLPAFWALPSAFLTSSAAAAAIGFINCTASIGGFVGPKIVGNLSQQSGSFTSGFLFMIACWTIASALVLLCPRE